MLKVRGHLFSRTSSKSMFEFWSEPRTLPPYRFRAITKRTHRLLYELLCMFVEYAGSSLFCMDGSAEIARNHIWNVNDTRIILESGHIVTIRMVSLILLTHFIQRLSYDKAAMPVKRIDGFRDSLRI